MCTAITYQTQNHYFGRNLDFPYGYREAVTITPRRYPFTFRRLAPIEQHYAMIGMATVSSGYPLYYDATNEYGLGMAGLYFPVSAQYMEELPDKENVATYELIPLILGTCTNTTEAIKQLQSLNLIGLDFSGEYPVSPLHWMVADKQKAVTIEPTKDGLRIYENPVGVLTNEPPFDYHMTNLNNYLNLTREKPENRFSPELSLTPYSAGMGGLGLPGDLSSASRFIKAAFTKMNSVSRDSESASISQVFHILGAVTQQQGCVKVGELYEKTIYTSCCNTTKGIYYYTTYENSQITGVRLHGVDLDTDALFTYPLEKGQHINMVN